MVYVVFLLPCIYYCDVDPVTISMHMYYCVGYYAHVYYCARVHYYAHVLLCSLLCTCIVVTITLHMYYDAHVL